MQQSFLIYITFFHVTGTAIKTCKYLRVNDLFMRTIIKAVVQKEVDLTTQFT